MAPLGVETVSTPTGLGVVTAQAATGTFNLPAITGPVTSLSCPGEVIWPPPPPPPDTPPPIPPDAIGIVGRITDAKSGQLLYDALVSVVGTELTTLANLYEVVPAGSEVPRAVDELRYQPEPDDPPLSEFEGEMMYVKVRYKDPRRGEEQAAGAGGGGADGFAFGRLPVRERRGRVRHVAARLGARG